MPDVGDQVTALLTVAPFDGATAAALTVYAPDGTVSHPTASTTDGGATWSAPLTYTAAGVWRLAWSVTGMGASVESELVSVAPSPGPPSGGRTYATTTQLANYLGAAPPLDSARLLERATQLLDADFLRPAVYDVDDEGMPTNALVIGAFAEAVCAQVEFWGEVGEETDISGPVSDVAIGSVSLKYGAGGSGGGSSYFAPKLVRALISLPHSVFRMSVWSVC